MVSLILDKDITSLKDRVDTIEDHLGLTAA